MFQTAFSVGMQATLVDNALRSFADGTNFALLKIQQAAFGKVGREQVGGGRCRAWLASKKFLKYGKFTGSGDVWGESGGNLCFVRWQKVV